MAFGLNPSKTDVKTMSLSQLFYLKKWVFIKKTFLTKSTNITHKRNTLLQSYILSDSLTEIYSN